MHATRLAGASGLVIHRAGYYCDLDDSAETIPKRVRNAQLAQYNYIICVGEREAESNTVNVRLRSEEIVGEMSVGQLLERMAAEVTQFK